jgi:Domain of unknown function (DUF6473)
MAYEGLGEGALNYDYCRYGNSKLMFRGPQRSLDGAYDAVVGGTETFGRFLEDPYPALLEKMTGRRMINLGCLNAGPGAFSRDATLLEICKKADVTIIEVMGVQNMSNRFYTVHPRRNDRFIKATDRLCSIYPDVDFTEFSFTGHLLHSLARRSRSRFELLRQELRSDWVAIMKKLVGRIGGKVVLLWLARHSPHHDSAKDAPWQAPAFIDQALLDQLSGSVAALVQVVATPDEIAAGLDRMVFTQFEEPAARILLGPIVHQEAARVLLPHFSGQ